ncbi:MAG: 1-acyl-sn-glycerol-3-phosphate acyltransferase [Alistipes sp.]|nr:1-acyl-sn-glycerol-3-phosphate acyltransferase [Alistipes sp.]
MLSLLFYIYTIVICTLMLILSAIVFAVTAPFDRRRRIVHEMSRLLVNMFYIVPPCWKRKVEGLENIDKRKSYVIVINHTSMTDIMALYFVPLEFRWVSKREVFRIPFFGQFLVLHGDIAIERGNGAEAMRKVTAQGRKWLDRGVSVSIFPEGTRSRDGEIGRFKAGAFVLAKEAGAEILPVVMDGTDTMVRKNRTFRWRNTIKIKILEPVSAERVAAVEQKELADEIRERMIAALNELRSK